MGAKPKRVYHMRAASAVEALQWVRRFRKDLEIDRAKEKVERAMRLAADKANAFAALTDRFYDYWQDANEQQTRLQQFFSVLDPFKVQEIPVITHSLYTSGNIGSAYRNLVLDLSRTYNHPVYLPDPV